jgi:hypothetical protein
MFRNRAQSTSKEQTSITTRIRNKLSVTVLSSATVAAGLGLIAVAAASQYHAPQPAKSAAGHVNPYKYYPLDKVAYEDSVQQIVGPVLARSDPLSISIPAVKVNSNLQYLGRNPNGTIQVPSPGPKYNEAAWYKYSPTPGEVGPSIIEGHIDSAAEGPSVFFELGALKPGNKIYVNLKDGTTAVFTVTAVRQYPKSAFPTSTVYSNTNFAALRLISCSGVFDHVTRSYLSNTVVFAVLSSSKPTS